MSNGKCRGLGQEVKKEMKIVIEASSKEVADFVMELQSQQIKTALMSAVSSDGASLYGAVKNYSDDKKSESINNENNEPEIDIVRMIKHFRQIVQEVK